MLRRAWTTFWTKVRTEHPYGTIYYAIFAAYSWRAAAFFQTTPAARPWYRWYLLVGLLAQLGGWTRTLSA